MAVWIRISLTSAFVLAILLGTAFTYSQPERDRGSARASEESYAGGGADTCLTCHGARGFMPATGILESPHGPVSNPHSPFAPDARGCESCHGPSAAHLGRAPGGGRPAPAVTFKAHEDANLRNAVCLDCHRSDVGTHWAASVHRFEELACVDCHQLHTARDPMLARQNQSELCFECHRPQRADFFRRSAHPVREGLQVCSDCHNAHGSPGPAMLRANSVNDSCYECHAEKRGPFLWEHAPVREDCSNCHLPHGSNHEPLLQARTPFLCQQCHLAQFHPSTALSGTGRPPMGASQLLLGKDCMSCHVAVHGSNHPSGSGLIR